MGFIFMRRRFRVLLRGSNIIIPSEDGTEPITGFYATRFVRAVSPEQAMAIAIAVIRSEWFNSPFSTANRSCGPAITVKETELIANPFRRSRPNKGYRFFKEGEESFLKG